MGEKIFKTLDVSSRPRRACKLSRLATRPPAGRHHDGPAVSESDSSESAAERNPSRRQPAATACTAQTHWQAPAAGGRCELAVLSASAVNGWPWFKFQEAGVRLPHTRTARGDGFAREGELPPLPRRPGAFRVGSASHGGLGGRVGGPAP